jgi:hypothetical protein
LPKEYIRSIPYETENKEYQYNRDCRNDDFTEFLIFLPRISNAPESIRFKKLYKIKLQKDNENIKAR